MFEANSNIVEFFSPLQDRNLLALHATFYSISSMNSASLSFRTFWHI